MKKLLQFKLVALLLLLFTPIMQAQFQNGLWTGKQAYNWYFGDFAGLDFNTSPPTPLIDGQINGLFSEGSGSISDSEGNLLFYSDGVTIWNKNHEIMQNGEGLLGNTSSTQTGLIIPKPGNENIYYIFSVEGEGTHDGTTASPSFLIYSEVDMSLAGGLGAVTSNKNVRLNDQVGEKLTAVYHADKEQIWVVCHTGTFGTPSNVFQAFLISDTGVKEPVISPVGEILRYGFGQMKISPDGTKIATVTGEFNEFLKTVQLFDFDDTTGEITNPINLIDPFSVIGYGLEFSPNSKYLYTTNQVFPSDLNQYDITAGNAEAIIASAIVIGAGPVDDFAYWSSLQVAPDGKIYLTVNNTEALTVINYPNNAGVAAGFSNASQNLANKRSMLGLPTFIQSYFESGILHEGECADEAVTFSTIRIPGITSVIWNFGDTASGNNNISTDLTPSHTFDTPGTYTVTAVITSNGAQQTATTQVVITAVDAVVPVVPAICGDIDGNAVFDLSQLDAGILNGQDAAQFSLNYYASEANIQADTPIATPANFTTTGQTIYAQVTNTITGCTTTIQFSLPVNPLPVAAAPAPIQKCASPSGTAIFNLKSQDAAILNSQDAANFSVTYYSDANAQDPIVAPDTFTSSGQTVYAVVSNTTTGCTSGIVSFTIAVTEVSLFTSALQLKGCSPFNLNLISSQLEEGLSLTFYPSEQNAEDNDNAIANSGQYSISAKQAIVYVVAQNADGCTDIAEITLQQGDCSIPKGISPNGDNKNDSFDLSGFNVSYLGIYNRYGQEVYSKDNYTSEWHGQTSNNNSLPTGTYYFMVQRNDGRSETGWVYINREE